MKININRSVCYVSFDEHDEKYTGKMISFDGEGNSSNEFCIYKSSKVCWVYPTERPSRYKSVWVDDVEKDELTTFVLEKANAMGYSLLLW